MSPLSILITGFVVSAATFVVVEAIAYEHDKSNITGFIWGTLLAVLFGTIVDVFLLLVKIHSL
jgi:predicted outer membrane lipoprotein